MKKKKEIFHIYIGGMLSVLCGLGTSHCRIIVPSKIDAIMGHPSARLCHKCKHIHKLKLRGN